MFVPIIYNIISILGYFDYRNHHSQDCFFFYLTLDHGIKICQDSQFISLYFNYSRVGFHHMFTKGAITYLQHDDSNVLLTGRQYENEKRVNTGLLKGLKKQLVFYSTCS